jgi:hypothetical protein
LKPIETVRGRGYRFSIPRKGDDEPPAATETGGEAAAQR